MKTLYRLAVTAALAGIAFAAPASAQSRADDDRFRAAQERFDNELNIFRQEYDRYQSVRSNYRNQGYNDPRYNQQQPQRYADDRYEQGYDPARYYRDGNYQERSLGTDDRVYRGNDGRYYCKRNDGTTGLIIGGAGGALLGNVIDGGHSRVVGTLLGGAIGALAGKSIDQNSSNNQIRCR